MDTIPVVNPKEPVDYDSCTTPSNYVCGKCEKGGVKLWCEYGSWSGQSFRCADCSAEEQGKDISEMDEHGSRPYRDNKPTDTIGWRVPALLTESNDALLLNNYAVPEAYTWWRRLPNR